MILPPESITEFAYVTPDLDASVRRWTEVMKAGPFFRMDAPPGLDIQYRGRSGKGTSAFCAGFLGAALIELIQPVNDEPSVFREGFDGTERLHHILPRMKPLAAGEFETISADYVKNGFEQVMWIDAPLFGRAAFFDARRTMGVFLELVEFLPPSLGVMERAWQAHANWDGSRPLRDITELL